MLVTANGAAERKLCSIWRVVDFERAASFSWALGQLALLLARDVVTVALPLVTRFAEVRVAPAEPLGDGAAELALELDEVGAVHLTVG